VFGRIRLAGTVMKGRGVNRRTFIQQALTASAGAAASLKCAPHHLFAADNLLPPNPPSLAGHRSEAKVALVSCRSYGPELRPALEKCFDLLGGIGSLVKGKSVAVKLNLTNGDFMNFLGRPVGETFMTHPATALALGSLLFAAGARRVRFVESTPSRAALAATITLGDWDVPALTALGKVEFENTRNLGSGKSYTHLRVPNGGYMFSAFDLNQSYEQTDVMISLAKLKLHLTAGVTLSMKNMFGITPNSLYGSEAGNEEATAGRGPLHSPRGSDNVHLPSLKEGITSADPTWRVPRITVDVCAARPIHLAIIDGITAMTGGEGPWCQEAGRVKLTSPGVLIAGLNPVSADAVATAVMGYPDPRAARGMKPFQDCDNHLLLAEQAGLGIAELARIDLRGMPIEKARYPYG
jgi:uncharacterized protein (DUF362 family)